MIRPGMWWVKCPSDSRWNGSGHSEFVGEFSMPQECAEFIDRKKAELGPQPSDLEYGYMKD